MRVIIIDDDKEMADLLKTALQLAFYEKAKSLAKGQQQVTHSLDVIHFGDQKEALRFLSIDSGYIDLIFIEVNSPGLSGFDFIQLCHEKHRSCFGDIVVVTDRCDKEAVKQGGNAGARDYILKPFAPGDLKVHIFNAWQSEGRNGHASMSEEEN